MSCGGWSDPKPADGDLKSQAEEKWTKQSYQIFKAIEYRVQPVAGTNFLIKVIPI
uniref:Cystatin domain-containing protein n=1 Tax=Fundulus heteroclitus TaxID=8078 RepID=A0A3Q2T8P7_FUNHE